MRTAVHANTISKGGAINLFESLGSGNEYSTVNRQPSLLNIYFFNCRFHRNKTATCRARKYQYRTEAVQQQSCLCDSYGAPVCVVCGYYCCCSCVRSVRRDIRSRPHYMQAKIKHRPHRCCCGSYDTLRYYSNTQHYTTAAW